jgi:uncharacterized protein DUF3987
MRLEEILSRFNRVKKSGKGYSAQCPAHDDKHPSLSITPADDRILVCCHVGCDLDAILAAVSLDRRDLFTANGKGRGDHGPITHYYVYTDENGKPLYRICRTASKDFKAQRYEAGAFAWGIDGVRRVIYNLPAVLKSKAVSIVEGEKDADTLNAVGLVATTAPFGAGKWSDDYAPSFKGKHVAILADNDDAGRRHAWQVAKSIISVVEWVKIVELPGLPDQGDVSDFLKDHTKDELLKLIKDTKPLTVEEVNSHKEEKQEWPEPQPLPDKLPPVPPMVAKMIPQPFRPWACDIAERMQCALDFPTVAAVITASSLIGRRLAIRPKKQDDWTVVPNLWGGAVGRPGFMKTPALDEGKKPLQRLEAEALEEHKKNERAHELRLMVIKAQKEEIQKKIREAVAAGNSTEGFELPDPKEEELKARRYIVNDSTVEKLGELLNQNPNGLLLFRDELTGWLRTLDREGHENDRAFYLEAWNGTGSYTYDRIGRGTLNIEAACVSILGGIQPGPLSDYLESTLKGGAGADGLFQRLQLLVYPDESGLEWENVDRWPDTQSKNAAFDIFRKLAGESFEGFVGPLRVVSPPDKNGERLIPFLRFSPEGQKVFDDWRGELEKKIRSGDEHPALEAHLSKYRSLMPSLALIFHVVSTIDEGQPPPVSEAAAKMAAAWCDYLEAHARRVYHGLIQHDVSTAHRLAKKIAAGKLPNPFTGREVYFKGWTGLSEAEVIEAGAAILDDLAWIKTERIKAGLNGGRPTLKYWINPNIKIAKAD